MQSELKFIALEKEYWAFRQQLRLDLDIKPANLVEERAKFLSEIRINKPYNPVFKYEQTEHFKFIDELIYFKKLFLKNGHPLSSYYDKLIDNSIDWIEQFKKRENKGFERWLTKLYGLPELNTIIEADSILNLTITEIDHTNKEPGKKHTAEDLKESLQSYLSNYDIKGWNINIMNMVARISVNSILGEIRIKDTAEFTEKDIRKLIVHEIDTHVLRSENGKKSDFMIFQMGFPEYIETEEGLAIFAEKQVKVRSAINDQRIALLAEGSLWCSEMDFYNLFMKLRTFLPTDEKAFDMASRLKRGLNDTSCLGGYTKDYVYLSGYLKIRCLPIETIKKLFIGKIGLQDLELINSMKMHSNYTLPSWLV